ncbi:hypothetical protein HanIR_Chr10g0456311 [Helianthus annuus]|nr:hypothetical protein HanIR_Chr10g0456311 [Helianthus annuus]
MLYRINLVRFIKHRQSIMILLVLIIREIIKYNSYSFCYDIYKIEIHIRKKLMKLASKKAKYANKTSFGNS